MSERLIRTYVNEAMLGLRRDPRLVSLWNRATGQGGQISPGARRVADSWIKNASYDRGESLSKKQRLVIQAFVEKRWSGMLERFRGDHDAAEQTMTNLLNSRFHELRVGT